MNLQFPYKTTNLDRLYQCYFLWKRSESCSYEEIQEILLQEYHRYSRVIKIN